MKKIYTFLAIALLSIIAFYFEGILGPLKLLLSLFVYAVLLWLPYIGWKMLRRKLPLDFLDYIWEFCYRVANITLLLFVILGGIVAYENEVSPATMPLYTLTNTEKSLQFQSMIHIGREEFYTQVRSSIYRAKSNGYVLYFEGVKPGSEENMEKFNAALGIQFDKELYKNFSKLYGVTFQDNEQFLGVVNNLDYNVDVSIDEVMALYDTQEEHEKTAPEKVEDLNKLVVDTLAELDDKKLKVLVYLNKGILNLLIKSDYIKETLLNEFGNKALFDVILHERNKVLAKEILESEHAKIFVTYGQLHFGGVLEILQASDPRWHIEKTEVLYPISLPSYGDAL